MPTASEVQVNGLFYTIATANISNASISEISVPKVTVPNGGLHLSGGSNGQVLATYGNGTTYWMNAADPNAAGTVTSVTTGGSGLGFSLSGGPITTTGTITLNAPTAATLRTNLSIGNVANLSLDGNSSNILYGNGVFATKPSGGSGTVTSVGGTGSGLGFNLSGTVTTSGSISLSVPSSSDLRTNMGLGNIATINATGSTTDFLRADGSWQPVSSSGTPLPSQSGQSGKFLKTDGSALSWDAPSGSGTVTNVAVNGSGLGFSLSGGPITSTGTITLNTPTTTALKTSLGMGNIVATNFNGNGSTVLLGNGAWGTGGNSGPVPNVPNLTGNTSQWLRGDGWSVLGNIAGINTNGNASQVLYGNGAFAALPAQTVYTAGNNISITANAISMDTLKFAKETFTTASVPSTGTVDIDVLGGSIFYNTANATTAIAINIRGNATTTFNSMTAVGVALTTTAMITNGPTPQGLSSVTIDGVAQTVKMIGGGDLTATANAITAYTFTVFKTAATPAYTVIGSKAVYK